MADEKENPASATGQMPRVRRRAPTIDLKATEVAVEPPPAAATAQSQHAAPPEYSTQPPDYDVGATKTADEPPPSPPLPPAPPPPQEKARASFPARPMVAAGLAGGLVALLISALLWLGGLFSGGESPSDQRLAAIEAQLRDVAARPPAPRNPESRLADDLNARLMRLENARQAEPSASAGSDAAVKQLQATVADLVRRTEESAVAARDARGQADAARTAEKTSVDAVADRMATLESTTKKLGEDVAKSLNAAGADKPLRAVIAAQALRVAVERGDPFAVELAAAKALSPNPAAFAPLEVFAASGLPSGAALTRELAELAPSMQKSPPPPTGGFLDRLQANAEKLVRIRPIDETPGGDPNAVVSRARFKAARSDFADAVAELNALPADIRAPADAWIKKAEARTAALNASRRLVADALAALGKAAP